MVDDSNTSAASGGCPVLVRNDAGKDSVSTAAKPGIWHRWFSRSTTNDAPTAESSSIATTNNNISECPVKGNKSSMQPASIEEAANHSQVPLPGQKIPLSTQRVISSIPRGNNEDKQLDNKQQTKVPAHQPTNSSKWQYPSEQQFYNAMRKKGYQPPVESIPSVLQIHNAVNERSWSQICKWEKEIHDNDSPKLVKFVGRPKDISPKAWLNSRLFMTQEPFDRHDWYIQDNHSAGDGSESETTGEPRRYVIDFYEGKEKTGHLASSLASPNGNGAQDGGSKMPVMKPPSMYIDVRPALDNPSAAVDRMTMLVRETLPGLTGVWDSYKTSASSSSTSNVAEMEGAKKKSEE